MKMLRALLCSLVLMLAGNAATSPATAANDNTPPVHRVRVKAEHGHAQFAMWYADPARARTLARHFNRAYGWTVELLVCPADTLEYQVDGAQMNGDALPVFRFQGPCPTRNSCNTLGRCISEGPCLLQCPDAITPMLGQARAEFGLTALGFDVPMEALESRASGAEYKLQVYSLVPVDTTDLNVVVRFDPDPRGCFRGTIENGRLTFANPCPPAEVSGTAAFRTASLPKETLVPTPSETKSWGTIKFLYR